MNDELVTLLLQRVKEAGAIGRLVEKLKAIKAEQNLPNDFRLTGIKTEQAIEAARRAVSESWLPEHALAKFVDEVEENGAQHIFLFDLTDEGRRRLTANRLGAVFQGVPGHPTVAMYTETPGKKRTFFENRTDALTVKQIFVGSYWERDDDRSYDREDERATVMVRQHRRAVNLLRVLPEQQQVEIRIDRVRGRMDNTLALEVLGSFLEDLGDDFDLEVDVTPVEIWRALPRIAADRTEVYLNKDDAEDPSAKISFHNLRARDKGTDVRDHPKYQMRGRDVVRTGMNPYWIVPDEENKIYSNLTVLEAPRLGRCGKIYLSAELRPTTVQHVLDRIRHFAR
ncbi:MAG TPA: hypothetical protein VGD94_07960 [Vicinamibacterales bacterium]